MADYRDTEEFSPEQGVNTGEPRQKAPSVITVFTAQFVVITLVFAAAAGLLVAGLLTTLQRNLWKNAREMLEIYDSNITRALNEEIAALIETCSTNPDVSMLAVADDQEKYGHVIRIKNLMTSRISLNSTIDGFYIYAPANGTFIPSYNSGAYNFNEGYLFPAFLRDLLDSHSDGTSIQGLDFSRWFLHRSGEKNYLIRLVRTKRIYAGAWIDLKNIPSFEYFVRTNALVALEDENGELIAGSLAGYQGIPAETTERPKRTKLPDGRTAVVSSSKLSFCDYYITAIIPSGSFVGAMQPVVLFLGLFVLWIIAFFVFVSRLARKMLVLPVDSLDPAIQRLKEGRFDSRVEPANNYQEVVKITDTFNHLIGEIQDLRISVYEKQIATQEFELKALKHQVAPHFLINCLNTIFASSMLPDNQEMTNHIIETLSEHLRYTLADEDTVTLKDELYYLDNYIRLTQYRFPDTLRCEIDTDPALERVRVFPLILLTLTENSIKTGVIMGEPFFIRVRCYAEDEDGRERVILEHTDSGTGLTEEQLVIYNHIFEHPEVTEKGTGIGLYNTAMRLKLIFGEDASIRFENEEGMGLKVTLNIPRTEL